MENKEKTKSIGKEIFEWTYCIIIAVVLALLIKYFIGTPTVVKQSSMYPTLKQNDRLLLNRVVRTTKKMPKRGDIITFQAPSKNEYTEDEVDLNNAVAVYDDDPTNIFKKFMFYVVEAGKTSYIKRVIALPGEHVEIKDGKVYINGVELVENYLGRTVKTEATGVFNDFIVPENCVFAMGDNRTGSMDCRVFGCIPLEKIESKVIMRFWPFGSTFGKVDKVDELYGTGEETIAAGVSTGEESNSTIENSVANETEE